MEKIGIEEKTDRCSRFYAMDLDDGPLAGFFLGSYYPLLRYRGSSSLPHGPVKAADVDAGAFADDYRRLSETYNRLPGETIWTGSIFWGIPWMEALAGCGVTADHSTGSMRSTHPPVAPEADNIARFDRNSPCAAKAKEFIDLLTGVDLSFPLGTTLMRGLSVLLSAIYGTPGFVYRLYDRREEISRTISRLAELWIAFAEYQFDCFPRFRGGTGSYFYNLRMPGRGVEIQEDPSTLLSPELFEEFVLPSLSTIIRRFDTVIIHLHPTGYIPVDPLIKTDLAAIELHVDKGGPAAEELLPVYRKIQSRKPLVVWGDLSEDDLSFLLRRVDSRSLAVLPVVQSVGEAEALWRTIKRGARRTSY